jgi:hypothetical protein
MKSYALFLLFAVTGCSSSSDDGPAGPTLPNDAYFVYSDVDQCLADNPDDQRGCSFALALCSNGRAGARIGDIIDDGTYEMDGPVAHGELRGSSFTFDVETGAATGLSVNFMIPDTEQRWQTLQFDSIDCSRSL